MDLRHIKAIIFDAEGVVVDTEALWDKSQEVLLGRRNLEYDRDYLKPKMAGQTLLEGAQLMVDYYKLDENPVSIEQERKELIHDLFENEIAFVHGFIPFISQLNGSPLKRSVATAMKKSLMIMVEHKLQLTQFFGSHIYFIEDVGNKSKPSPDVFLYAAEKLGENPSDCLVIEDAPHGIDAANRAGMTSVGITTTFTKAQLCEADFVGDDFDEIRRFLLLSGVGL
jgi:HAD superfamily hydrolase (TIGR01509 family)